MRVTRNQLVKIFNRFLETKRLQFIDPLPVFLTEEGGEVLVRRLTMCLKDPKWAFVYKKDVLNVEPFMCLAEPHLKKGFYITGLNYRFTEKDIPELFQIYKELFQEE